MWFPFSSQWHSFLVFQYHTIAKNAETGVDHPEFSLCFHVLCAALNLSCNG